MEKNKKNTTKIGTLGEKIAIVSLKKKGYAILDHQYKRKWGELDIVASKGETVHFIEVKTLSYETREKLQHALVHETWRPEEQVHQFKLHQIAKVLETWVASHQYEGKWQIDVIAVRMVPRETFATIKYIENITL